MIVSGFWNLSSFKHIHVDVLAFIFLWFRLSLLRCPGNLLGFGFWFFFLIWNCGDFSRWTKPMMVKSMSTKTACYVGSTGFFLLFLPPFSFALSVIQVSRRIWTVWCIFDFFFLYVSIFCSLKSSRVFEKWVWCQIGSGELQWVDAYWQCDCSGGNSCLCLYSFNF